MFKKGTKKFIAKFCFVMIFVMAGLAKWQEPEKFAGKFQVTYAKLVTKIEFKIHQKLPRFLQINFLEPYLETLIRYTGLALALSGVMVLLGWHRFSCFITLFLLVITPIMHNPLLAKKGHTCCTCMGLVQNIGLIGVSMLMSNADSEY